MKNKNLEPVFTACQSQLGLTFSTSDSLDSKALGILAFNGALLLYTFQITANLVSIMVASSLFLLSSHFICAVIWPKVYREAIVEIEEHPEYLALSESRLLLQLIADTRQATTQNKLLNSAVKPKIAHVPL